MRFVVRNEYFARVSMFLLSVIGLVLIGITEQFIGRDGFYWYCLGITFYWLCIIGCDMWWTDTPTVRSFVTAIGINAALTGLVFGLRTIRPDRFDVVAACLGLAIGAVVGTLLYWPMCGVIRMSLRHVRQFWMPSQCKSCSYCLIGVGGCRCPECGTPIDPKQLERIRGINPVSTNPTNQVTGNQKLETEESPKT